MNKFFATVLSLFLSFSVFAAHGAQAARIDLLPRKIVLEDRQSGGELTIMNMGNKSNHVRISFLSYRQDEKGVYHELKTPLNPAFDPETVVRISPKQFTLPPNGRQKVRFSIRKPADLPDGEYRFHIKAISFDDEEFSVRRKALEGSNMSVKTNLALVIPVVVRKGELQATAKIKDIGFISAAQSSSGKPALKLTIAREGNKGVMGTLRAVQKQAGAAEPVEIGIVSNLNVFAESDHRDVEMPLEKVPGPGPITLIYTNDFGDKGVLDEVTLER